MDAPAGLKAGGTALWLAVTEAHDLDATQVVQLEEACRAKDRCDQLDAILRANMDGPTLTQANATANLMKQLLAAMRLPDSVTGKKPQLRAARGAYKSAGAGISSLDRARAAKSS